jgi:hypothetical protein
VQRRQDAERGIHARGDVRDRHARPHAAAAGFAGDADHPALGLHHQVERRAIAIGTILSKAGNRAVDDARLMRADAFVVNPELFDGADAQVLEDDVGGLEQAKEQRLAVGMLQVERDALLVAIQVHEVRRLAGIERRSPGARDFALGRLDLDHRGAVVPEHRRGKWPRQRVGQVEDGDVVEWRRHAGLINYHPCLMPSLRPPRVRRSAKAGAALST